jgi:hypothetical protein
LRSPVAAIAGQDGLVVMVSLSPGPAVDQERRIVMSP